MLIRIPESQSDKQWSESRNPISPIFNQLDQNSIRCNSPLPPSAVSLTRKGKFVVSGFRIPDQKGTVFVHTEHQQLFCIDPPQLSEVPPEGSIPFSVPLFDPLNPTVERRSTSLWPRNWKGWSRTFRWSHSSRTTSRPDSRWLSPKKINKNKFWFSFKGICFEGMIWSIKKEIIPTARPAWSSSHPQCGHLRHSFYHTFCLFVR